MNEKEYLITFPEKVSEKQYDRLYNNILNRLPQLIKQGIRIVFDLSSVEWFANQELLVFTAILKYLVEIKHDFFVKFLPKEGGEKIDRRKAVQIVQIWEVWKIGSIIGNQNYAKHFDMTSNFTTVLRQKYGIDTSNQEIYNRYGVTPFISLEKIENFDDLRISEKLSKLYQLNDATKEILLLNNCRMPFDNKTLSSIITKELYENFLDHFQPNLFRTTKNYSFLSISLKTKLNEVRRGAESIQSILKKNFDEEMIPELAAFYTDPQTKELKNQSILQLTFADFGSGICRTLERQFLQAKKEGNVLQLEGGSIDDNILAYAFQFDSSKDPIDKRYLGKKTIPRGLFDLITIVRRFNGLLIARSNRGKIMYDFSRGQSFNEAISRFGDPNIPFQGTLVSIYLPERKIADAISAAPIKPFENLDTLTFLKKKVVNLTLFDIQSEIKKLNLTKDTFYNKVFERFISIFENEENETLFYIDFNGFEIDERVTKKLIYFLTTDYRINSNLSVIILNPPPYTYLDNIRKEMLLLPEVVKQYHFHPTPFVYFSNKTNDIRIFWLGIFSDPDIDRLNNLLFEISDLRHSDFEQPESIIGNVNYYDQHGNLISLIDRSNIISVLNYQRELLNLNQVKRLVLNCLKREPQMVYLCNGNYYQEVYLQLIDLLINRENCRFLANILFEKLQANCQNIEEYCFICNTASSQKIIDQWIATEKIEKKKAFAVKGDLSQFLDAIRENKISNGSKFILVCDVLSTGYMWNKLLPILTQINMKLEKICVIVNGIDVTFEPTIQRYNTFRDNVVSLIDYPMRKYRRSVFRSQLLEGALRVRRINPYTNSPIIQSIEQNINKTSSLLSNEAFIDILDESHIKAGYYKFNNLIHPYFFDMDTLLKDDSRCKRLLRELFSKMQPSLIKDLDILFFPKNSGIENLDLAYLRDNILGNHKLEIIELERFATNEGWRFPHPPEFLYKIAEGKKVLILDDGSCSGESVIQMVDEIATLNVSQITVLSIIGRINDHKKDFFSRIRMVTTKEGSIKTTILFGSHWHVPTYYIEESPVIKEKAWLEEILQHSNLPYKIRITAENVLGELKLKEIKEPNNRYLLQPKKGAFILKDLLLSKEAIGRISTYRFYKEHFDFFDEFILEYENEKASEERYKKIELIAAVFLHEPNLYGRVKEVLPDLTEKLEVFITTIFFGNPTKAKRPILDKKSLYYKWSNKNLFHLYFIVFQGEQLFAELSAGKLIEIMNRFCQDETDLNYLLYRLLRYLPHKNSTPIDMKYAGKVAYLLNAVIENHTLNGGLINKCKRFRSFISTLSNNNDFEAAITRLKNNYSKLTDDQYHNQSVTVQVDVIVTQLELLESKYDQSCVNTINKVWPDISAFIEDLLSFSKTYPSFFTPCEEKVYSRLEKNNDSLRSIHGELSEAIYSLSEKSEFAKISKLIQNVFQRFVISSSVYHEIFSRISTPDIIVEYNLFLMQLETLFPHIECVDNKQDGLSAAVAVPEYYIKDIMFSEILKNFRHCDPTRRISFNWEVQSQYLILTISNGMRSNNRNGGGGSGILKLESLSRMPDDIVNYEKVEVKETNEFFQIIKLKRI